MKPAPSPADLDHGIDAFEPLEEFHRITLRMLAELAMLVARVEEVGVDPRARAMARSVIHYFSFDLPGHHIDEEAHVFPALAECGDAETMQAVARLKQDHAWLRADWRVLSPLVRGLAGGQSWVDIDALRDGVEVFCALSRDHIALEESIIYPRARIRMLESTRRETRLALASRR
jgi:iron-sulfur cluster repair protein YtfE (RIC family)